MLNNFNYIIRVGQRVLVAFGFTIALLGVTDSTAALSGTTYLVVGRLSKSIPGAGSIYNRFALWVNPTAAEENSPDVSVSLGGNISSFTTVGLRSLNLDPGDSVLFDNLQLSTTFQDIVTIPEPGSMMLLGCGGALLVLFGRRCAVRG
jgi:hypothetical protein